MLFYCYMHMFKVILSITNNIMFIVVKTNFVPCNNIYILIHFMSQHAMLASQWLTWMLSEKMHGIKKECFQPYDFCGVANMSARDIVCTLFILEL